MNKVTFQCELNYKALKELVDDINQIADSMNVTIGEQDEKKSATSDTLSPEIASAGTPPPTSAEVDNDGVPWDERIHSSSKGKTAKGIWKKRKNLADGEYDRITAELKGYEPTPPAANSNSTPPNSAAVAEINQAAAGIAPAAPAPAPAAPAPAPAAPAPAAPTLYLVDGTGYTADELRESGWEDDQIATLRLADQPTATAITFPELMQQVTAGIKDGTITQADVDAACATRGIASLTLAAANQELIPQLHADLFGG